MRKAVARAIEGLYAITPDTQDTVALCDMVAAALRAGVRLVQYRNKSAPAERRAAQAQALAAMCRSFGAGLIVNDDPKLAVLCGARGVHLGAGDPAAAQARQVLGPEALIGVSCYSSVERAVRAQAEGADYVAFGSFFPSTTKPEAAPASLSLLSQARAAVALPVVAIGGITVRNAARVIEAGADAVAVSNALFGAVPVEPAARHLIEIVTAALKRRTPAATAR
jgi:thiamine-phosphate pyrophosphorylase